MPAADQDATLNEELRVFERATQNLVGLALRSLDGVEVSLPQIRLLMVLQRRGECTSGECARALGVGNSSVTRLADRLNASGHLRRGSDPAHRSIVTLSLTDKGRAVVQQVAERRRTDLSDALSVLDPAERAACAAALNKLDGHISGQSDETSSPHLPL